MFHLAIRSSKLQNVPYIGMFKEAPARKGSLEIEQFRRLRQELPEHLKPVATLAYFVGMRSGEIKRLRWGRRRPASRHTAVACGRNEER